MSQEFVFTPVYGKAVTVGPTTASARSELGRGQKQFVVTNLGTVPCYVKPDGENAVATVADYNVLPDTQVAITKDKYATHIAYLAASGTGELHIIPGEGF